MIEVEIEDWFTMGYVNYPYLKNYECHIIFSIQF